MLQFFIQETFKFNNIRIAHKITGESKTLLNTLDVHYQDYQTY
jgi:hypothetical protein